MGESNKMVKLQDVVQAKQVPFKKKNTKKTKRFYFSSSEASRKGI